MKTMKPAGKTVTELFDLINNERANDLDQDTKLTEFAQKHADWMAERDRLRHSGGPYAEVISYQSTLDTQVALEIWMNSPPHQQILIGPYKKIGLAYAQNKRRTFWCAVFGSGQPIQPRRPFPRL